MTIHRLKAGARLLNRAATTASASEAIRTIQVCPTSVPISIIWKIWRWSSMKLDTPLMDLAICSIAAIDSNMPITAVPAKSDSTFKTAPLARSFPLRLYRPNTASPKSNIRSIYSAKRSVMLIESPMGQLTLKVTAPVIGWVSEETALHSTL